MSAAKWYPVKRQTVGKRLICPICLGWGTVTDQRTEQKRMCCGCRGIGRLKPKTI